MKNKAQKHLIIEILIFKSREEDEEELKLIEKTFLQFEHLIIFRRITKWKLNNLLKFISFS